MSGKIQSIGIPKSSQNVEGMIGSEKFGESHSAYGEKSAIQSVPKYQIRRMVFNSATATVKTSLQITSIAIHIFRQLLFLEDLSTVF